MEFNLGILLIISSSILFSPLVLCRPDPVSYISDVPASSPAPSPALYISDVLASSPAPSPQPDILFTDFTSEVTTSESSPAPPSLSSSLFSSQKNSLSTKETEQSHHFVDLVPKEVGSNDPNQLSSLKKICDVTEDASLCANSVLPFLKGKVDPVNVLQTQIKTFVNITEKAIEQLKTSMEGSSKSGTASDCLQVCLEIYDSAHSNLKQALDAISSHDMDLLKSVLSAAITDLGTCDDTFAESGEELPLDNDLVGTLHKLATIAMDISAVLLA